MTSIEPIVTVNGQVVGTLEHVGLDDEGRRLYRIVERVPAAGAADQTQVA